MKSVKDEPYSSTQMQALLAAASGGDLPGLERLTRHRADTDTRGLFKDSNQDEDQEMTMLYAVALSGRLEVMELLIRKGAEVNLPKDGDATLLTAAHQGHPRVLDLLLRNGADIRRKGFGGTSALHEAVAHVTDTNSNGKITVLEILLNYGLDIEVVDEDGHTAMHCAALYGSREMAEVLVSKGANINAKNKWGDVPLDRAAMAGRVEVAKFLLGKGADVNNNERECNGLGQAASHGHTSMVELLLDHGGQVIPQQYKRPELLLAARSGTAATVRLLYERGFACQGPESLLKATLIDPLQVIKLLVLQGIDVNVRNTKGQSLLQFVVLGKRFEPSTSQGILHPRVEVLENLLDKGADAKAEDLMGQTAKDLAIESNYVEAIELFENKCS